MKGKEFFHSEAVLLRFTAAVSDVTVCNGKLEKLNRKVVREFRMLQESKLRLISGLEITFSLMKRF